MVITDNNQQVTSPTVSVIMNCFNSAQYLKEAIDSVYAQTYKDWEIIFWDNASTDNSHQIAQSYGEKLRYFRSQETVNIGKARNLALNKAQGKYIAFLDCDDLWLPEKLEKQIVLFEKNPKVGLVFCDTILFDDKGNKYQLYKRNVPFKGRVFRKLLERYYLSMETVVIRKDSLNVLAEWFDERFNMVEEADLFTRIAYAWEFDYVPQALAMWRIRPTSLTFVKKHLFPQEGELQLEKYIKLYPGFDEDYSKEIQKMKAKIQYQYALLDWEKGEDSSVRRRLSPYLFTQKKYVIPYIFSFFPYKFYSRIFNRRALGA